MYTCFGMHLASTEKIRAACALVCTGVYNARQLEYAHLNAVCLQNRVGNVGKRQCNAGYLVCFRCHRICDSVLLGGNHFLSS
jgi:hypothetical protein